MIFHIIVLLVMALWFNPISEDKRVELTALSTESTDLEKLTTEDIQPLDVSALDASEMEVSAEDIAIAPSESISDTVGDELAGNAALEIDMHGSLVESSVLTQTISQGMGESLSGIRGGPTKEAAIRKGGGNAESEAAVAAALKWLASQQLSDGGWTFDLRKTPNPNRNPGDADRARSRRHCDGPAAFPGRWPHAERGSICFGGPPWNAVPGKHRQAGKHSFRPRCELA